LRQKFQGDKLRLKTQAIQAVAMERSMPLPNFSPEEQYLINIVKSSEISASNPYMWGYVIAGLLMCGFAAYHNSIPLLVCAFLVICGFRLYEEWYQRRWMPIWRSIIDKFEHCAMGTPHSSGSERD